MQEDFHYYATYCAAFLAGYSHEESLEICFSAQFVDICTKTFLSTVRGPKEAATTQLSLELMDTPSNAYGLQEITTIWSSFHFLPYDLDIKLKHRSRAYTKKYRMICDTNSKLLIETVKLAKDRNPAGEKNLQAVGIAMHILADTWAHRYFAGTPSLVINNTDSFFYEILEENGKEIERPITFKHSTSFVDNLEKSEYVNSIYQYSENSIMNLGHGRAGHLPDYSFIKYKYLPAWKNYEEVIKDNPSDFYHAFCQMIYAMKTIREGSEFVVDTYDFDAVAEYEERIKRILTIRRLSASEDWKIFGECLSGKEIPEFNLDAVKDEYLLADGEEAKENTTLGRFFEAAMAQKKMVSTRVYRAKKLKKMLLKMEKSIRE